MLVAAEQLDLTIVYEPGEEGCVIAPIPGSRRIQTGQKREEARERHQRAVANARPRLGEAGDQREREALVPLNQSVAAIFRTI